jgi:hypothetical protein
MTSTKRRQWEARVREWVASGQSATVFASAHGFNANTLVHWKWRLGAEARAGRSLGAGGFLEVIQPVVAVPAARRASRLPAPLSPPGRGRSFEVILPGDLRISVPPDFDAAALRRLVGALEVR